MQVAAHRQTVDVRHVDVEHRGVEHEAALERVECLAAVRARDHVAAVVLEPDPIQLAKSEIVLGDEDSAHVSMKPGHAKNDVS